MSAGEPTHFLNVDLELAGARASIDTIADELAPGVFELHRGRIGRLQWVHLEVVRQTKTLDATLRELVRLVRGLSPAAKRVWRAARRRDFNIGIQAGPTPKSSELAIEPATVQAVASLGGRLVITVYAPPPITEARAAKRARPGRRGRSS
jgi:hypothetical protein